MKTLPLVGLLSLVVFVPAVRAAEGTPGEHLYVRYCGACHGPTGRGDGVAATFLRPKPTDLTLLAKKNHGEFNAATIASYVDGTKPVGAHGTRDMPVWGEILGEEPNATAAGSQAKIAAIVEYLRSVQRK